MYFSTTLISEKRKFSYTKCCWWDLWPDILKEEFQCVYQEANGVKIQRAPREPDSLRAQVQDKQDENKFNAK